MATQIEVPTPGQRTVVETTDAGSPGPTTHVEPATSNYRAVQVIWMVTGLVTILVGIRFVLKLLGASTLSGFVSFIYGLTDALIAPFRAIFTNPSGSSSTIDLAALVAIVVYALIGWGLVSIVKLITAPKGARAIS
jgi:uncharacterized protein YggT (Ycf19 family)